MSDTAFALDLGEKYIKIADIEKKKDKYLAKSLAYSELSTNFYTTGAIIEHEKIASQLQMLIKDAGIKKKNVNIVIPDSQSYSKILEMPLLTEKELFSAIKYQADQLIPLPIEKLSLDLQILDEDKINKKLTILLVAAENSNIDKVIKIAEMSGLIPEKIENETSSTLRLISEIFLGQKNEQSSILFINFGYRSTSLYLFNSLTSLPLEIYNYSLGFNIFIKDIQANYNLKQEDINKLLETIGFSDQESESEKLSSHDLSLALSAPYKEFVSELEKFITSAKNKFNNTVNNIFIFGEGFKINSFEKKLSNSLGIEVKILDMYPHFIKSNTTDFVKNDLPLFISSIGANL